MAHFVRIFLVGDVWSTRQFLGEGILPSPTPRIESRNDMNERHGMILQIGTSTRPRRTRWTDGRGHNFTCRLKNREGTWTAPVFPHLIIVGAQKAGTTALGRFLRTVPNVIGSKEPEAHFWDGVVKNPKNWSSPERKCDLIKHYYEYWDPDLINSRTVMFEKTPSLLSFPKYARIIHYVLKPHRPKILIILRDPVARFYSHYEMNRQRFKLMIPPLEEILREEIEALRNVSAMDVPVFQRGVKWNQSQFMIPQKMPPLNMQRSLLQRGFYAPQVAQYMKFFPLGTSLKVIHYENFTRNKNDGLNDILNWIGAPSHNLTEKELNEDWGPYKNRDKGTARTTDNDVTTYLKHLYKPLNARLSDLLGEEWQGVWDDP